MRHLRFGGYQPERSVHTRAVRVLDRELVGGSGGRLGLEITPEIIALGRAAVDLLTLTEGGQLDLCYFASSYIAHRVPELSVLDLPFQGGDRARLWRRLEGEAGAMLKAAVAKRTGFELVAFWDNGIRHISNGVRPIRRPQDCEGLSIRTLDNAFHQALFSALGFRPRFIDVKDLAQSVRSRAVDAQENPLTNVINFEIGRTHRYVTLLGQFSGVALVLAGRQALQGLDAKDREAFEGALQVATESQRKFAVEEDETCLAALRAQGVEIVGPDAIDFAAFKAAVRDVVAKEAAGIDPELLAAWTR